MKSRCAFGSRSPRAPIRKKRVECSKKPSNPVRSVTRSRCQCASRRTFTWRERPREGKVEMTLKNPDVQPMEDPNAQLERAFIDEFLRLSGHDPEALRVLPEPEVLALMEAASIYAAGKLAEFESRAHYVHDIHARN